MINPAEIGRHCGFSVPRTMEFCAETLTGVNAHNEALLLRALRSSDYAAAHRILDIDKEMTHGPLFGPEISQLVADRDALMKKYAGARKYTEL